MTNGCVNQQIGSWTSRSVAANTSDGVAEVEAEKTLRVGVKGSVLCDVTEASSFCVLVGSFVFDGTALHPRNLAGCKEFITLEEMPGKRPLQEAASGTSKVILAQVSEPGSGKSKVCTLGCRQLVYSVPAGFPASDLSFLINLPECVRAQEA
ncbi:hypothetical protein F443_20537 [Phytophthora nicotianae P1569]|uniref:Uncharacterized protein n=2 Tax=Phytophthora nicotianae TaxID=4792 RepID=V9E180_PHYNI|nr:hypothetical protein F443_20537 [Phytophthora nicotianae P1569]ETO61445.1 hypothetical protein F444_20543 [Phytophthora nicotianae P1976]